MNAVEQFDEQFARKLQEEYDREVAAQVENEYGNTPTDEQTNYLNGYNGGTSYSFKSQTNLSPVDPSLEYTDPNPDIRLLFIHFNDQFFSGKLSGIEVKWSPRMTLCAGLCVYEGRGGFCSVRLSQPLLKLRPRKDLVETLLHEMIHAFLFITNNDRDHDGHGPQFQCHMHRINKATGANISIYHTFHDEVASYQQHWWRCDGPCQTRKPFFGYVKRAMNRAPSCNDNWWAEHKATCGGKFTKIKEPEGYGQKKGTKKERNGNNKDIRSFGGKGQMLGSTTSGTSSRKDISTSGTSSTNDISSVGTIKNPASIFNVGKTAVSSNSGKLQSVIISNGVLQRQPKGKYSALFSNFNSSTDIQNTSSLSKINRNTTQPHLKLKEEKPLESRSRNKNVGSGIDHRKIDNKDSSFVSFSKPANRMNPNKGKKETFDNRKNKRSDCDDAFRDVSEMRNFKGFKNKRSRMGAFFKGSRKRSVCEGGVYFIERKTKKYILDELDSNDGLWDKSLPNHTGSKSTPNTGVKSELCVSPTKGKLKDNSVKREMKQNKDGSNKMVNTLQGTKVEKSPSSQLDIRSFISKNSSFSGRGYRLCSGEHGGSSSWQNKTSVKKEVFGSESGKKRTSNEAFDIFIVDDSEDEDCHDSQTQPLKRSKSDRDADNVSCSGSETSDFRGGNTHLECDGQDSNSNADNENTTGNKVNCPVCGVQVSQTEINSHLDLCLQS